MPLLKRFTAFIVAGALLPFAQASASFLSIDDMGGNRMAGAIRTVTLYPLPQTSTTTNGSSFTESGGIATITLGGNGNTAGAVDLRYDFQFPVDLTNGGTNTQFFLVNDKIERTNYDPVNGPWTALSTTIYVTDSNGVRGGYNTGIANVPEGQTLILNFNCSTNPVCFSPQPDFAHVSKVEVYFAFPQNYDPVGVTTLLLDSIYTTPTGAVFPPAITSPSSSSATFTVGSAGSVQFQFDGAPTPTVSLTGTLPAGVTFNSSTLTLSGTPAAGTAGQYPVTITGTNSVGQTSRAFTLNVQGPPTITTVSNPPQFSEKRSDTFTIAASGYPAPAFSLSSGSLPSGVTLNSSTGVISGIPTNANSSYTFAVTASNGFSPAATHTYTMTVNRAPQVSAGITNTNEDTPVTFTPAAFPATDADGNTLMLKVGTLPSNGTLKLNGNPVIAGQQIAWGYIGNLTFQPNANWNGTTNFGWAVSDGIVESSATFETISVAAVNDPPVITQGSSTVINVNEDTPILMSLTATDVDNDSLTWSVATAASHGMATVSAIGAVQYIPAANYFGSDTFSIQVSDGKGGAATYSVVVNLASVNDLPVITGSNAVTMDEDGTPTAFALTLGATDVDSTTLTWSIGSPAAHGTATVSGTGASKAIAYVPNANYNGSDSFTVRVTDEQGGISTHPVSVTITPQNDAPVITSTAVTSATQGVAYTYTFTATDVDSGDTLTRSAPVLPAWLSFNAATGVLSGTPGSSDVGTHNVTLQVTDGKVPVQQSFVVTVANVNDAPVISGTPPAQVLAGAAYSFTPVATDADAGTVLSFTIVNVPAWLHFNTATGALTGAPGNSDAGVSSGIVITVSDGQLTASLPPFTLTVLGDLDRDGIADNVDPDIDGDGIPNTWETAHGLNPYDPSDAGSDLDGDGHTALQEYGDGTDPNKDDIPPVISLPADIVVPASGLLTRVDLGTATAVDDKDGSVAVHSDAPATFAPGLNTVTWSATDAAGNVAHAKQTVEVTPLVELGPEQVAAEGGSVTIKVTLNGPAAHYPVVVPYTVSGTATSADHDLTDGTFTINSGTEASVVMNVVDDGAGEGTETVVIQLGTPSNAVPGPITTETVDLVEGNVAPQVKLIASQNGADTRLITGTGGPVVVTAAVADANPGDTHQYDWQRSDNDLIDQDGNQQTFTIDPSTLSPGLHTFRVTVSDGQATTAASLQLNLVAAAPVLGTADSDGDGTDDATEGFGDSDQDGIPNYLDAIDTPNVLQSTAGSSSSGLLETEPGLTVALGNSAFRSSKGGAVITIDDLQSGSTPVPEDSVQNVGGLFDFTIANLPKAGESIRIVLPQLAPIPADAVYRKLMPGGWRDFVRNVNNRVASAPGEQGICPPPGDPAYTDGLTEGNWCVQLTIQDGGPNDDDGVADSSLSDPGGVASRPMNALPLPATRFGGGGAWSIWSLALLLLLGLATIGRSRREC